MVKSIPGDPAVLMLGPDRDARSHRRAAHPDGLDQPVYVQFSSIVNRLLHGDLGTSWQTTRPVLDDLIQRFPATLELVTFGLLLAIAMGMPLGVASALNPKGWVRKLADYLRPAARAPARLLVRARADLRLLHVARLAPAPLGRIDIEVIAAAASHRLHDDRHACWRATWRRSVPPLAHLVLPVLTLGLINAGPILKMTQSTHGEDARVRL